MQKKDRDISNKPFIYKRGGIYICTANDGYQPKTYEEVAIADTGICPLCNADMYWQDYPEGWRS